MNSPPRLTIDHFTLSAPGLGRAEAVRLAEAVAHCLHDLPTTTKGARQLGSVRIKVESNHGQGLQPLAQQIARSIQQRLR